MTSESSDSIKSSELSLGSEISSLKLSSQEDELQDDKQQEDELQDDEQQDDEQQEDEQQDDEQQDDEQQDDEQQDDEQQEDEQEEDEQQDDEQQEDEQQDDEQPGVDKQQDDEQPGVDKQQDDEQQEDKQSLKMVSNLKKSLYNATLNKEEIAQIYSSLNKDDENYLKNLNILVNNVELLNSQDLKQDKKYNFLYPSLDDPNFNLKIAKRKEFNENRNRDTMVDNIEEQADKLCNAEFELASHQLFVKNFLSFYTPYNCLLLYHGLGTGKTCSAIGIAEETRDYLMQLNINQKIMIIASPNVQDNFRQQLFNEKKLEFQDGQWNIDNCVGNKFLRELNLSNYKELSRQKIITQINNIINNYYHFIGYTEFANLLIKVSNVKNNMLSNQEKRERSIQQIRRYFNHRLIIIDEVQNIRIANDDKNKLVAQQLMYLVEIVDNLKLVLLSATPLYNSYTEIIWLLNLMNKNDNRSELQVSDIFDHNGDFIVDETGQEIGRELLERKARGYISFVKGDNPYTFPYRIWPSNFNNNMSVFKMTYPTLQLNSKPIMEKIQHIDLYINKIGEYQEKAYSYVIEYIKYSKEHDKQEESKKEDSPVDESLTNEAMGDTSPTKTGFDELDKFGYTILQKPIEALNIVYPIEELDDVIGSGKFTINPKEIIGKTGLTRLMNISDKQQGETSRGKYSFKNDKFGNIFSLENIGNYSSKIKSILDNIIGSTGVVLIYSQYIDGGLIPMALALESAGFSRHGDVQNLFRDPPTEPIDALRYLKRDDPNLSKGEFSKASYIIISGDRSISPNNLRDFNACVADDNTNGSSVKVVLISQAAAEGLDFKFIRQVHILDPWYNMNRIEQIIGRAVRNCSHKKLPFRERNVQLFLHGTKLSEEQIEATDLYVYRLAEQKAIQIGKITRILKEVSVDCILNSNQQNFRENIINKTLEINLSSGSSIKYRIGDKPFTAACDYMDNCYYKCYGDAEIASDDIDNSTYGLPHIQLNNEKIIQKIKELMKQRYFYYKHELVALINLQREYPREHIDNALTELVNNRNQFIVDRYDRIGNLINIDDLYIYQPIELNDKRESLYNRMNPIDYKIPKLVYNVEQRFHDVEGDKAIDKLVKEIVLKPEIVTKTQGKKKSVVGDEIGNEVGNKKSEDPKLKAQIAIDEILDKNAKLAAELLKRIKADYDKAITEQILLRGEKDHFKIMSTVIKELIENQRISRETLYSFVVDHIVDGLEFGENMVLLNYLYNKTASELTPFEQRIFDYFDQKMINVKSVKGLIMQQKNQPIYVALGRDNLWRLAESEDVKDLQPKIDELKIPIEQFNRLVGFIGDFKAEFNIFRVKQMDKKRNTGARCDQSGKAEALKLLNEIVGESRYNSENTKRFNQSYICIFQELYLRLFDSEARQDKRWFFYPGEALINNIEKINI